MDAETDKSNTHRIIEILHQLNGLDISGLDLSFVYRTIQQQAGKNTNGDIPVYIETITANPQVRTAFVQAIHNSYSEFFRNALSFTVLEKKILPRFVNEIQQGSNTKLRVWAAACAAGQDAYSMAMLLEEQRSASRCSYFIFANDASPIEIEKADKGVFTMNEVQGLTIKRLNNWFTAENGQYTVTKELKKNIQFSVFDLLSEQSQVPPESIFGHFDIILCANVLMYYNAASRKAILKKLINSLSSGGVLMVGETERTMMQDQPLVEIYPGSCLFTSHVY